MSSCLVVPYPNAFAGKPVHPTRAMAILPPAKRGTAPQCGSFAWQRIPLASISAERASRAAT